PVAVPPPLAPSPPLAERGAESKPPKPPSGRIAVSAAPGKPAEPVATAKAEDHDAIARAKAERMRKLRQGGAFGYEPMTPEPARPVKREPEPPPEPVPVPDAVPAPEAPAAAPAPELP